MKLSIPKKTIVGALSRVAPVADAKASMPVLGTVKIIAEGEHLTLSATDLCIGSTVDVAAEVTRAGTCCVPAKSIYEMVKNAPEADIALELDEKGSLTIRAAKVKYKIGTMLGGDFPALPKPKEELFDRLPARILADVLTLVSPSMSTDDTRPHLAAAKLEWGAGVLIGASTDGHRLTKGEHKCPGAGFDALVPHKGVRPILSLAADLAKASREATLEIQVRLGNLFVRADGVTLSVKLADEQFPPYAKVIPSRYKGRVVARRDALIEATSRIALVQASQGNGIQIRFEPGVIRVQSANPEVGEGSEDIDIDYAGETLSVGFNAKYLLDALRAFAGNEVALELGGELDPVVLKPIDTELEALVVVMPMRIT